MHRDHQAPRSPNLTREPAGGGTPPPPPERARGTFLANVEDAAADTELNMTPMIDIVFQLIIFFLLTLKFKTLDERIDANLPKDRGGPGISYQHIETPRIKVKLFRREAGNPDAAHTLVAIDQTHRFRLHETRVLAERDPLRAQARLTQILERKRVALADPDTVVEIHTPRPSGSAVPYGDVVLVVDAARAAGLTKSRFEGAPMPSMGLR